MSYVLRVGERAVTTSGGAVALPIEGGRTCVDGDVVRVILSFSAPTEPERRAVEHGPVDLGVFADGGLAALLLRIGVPIDPQLIEVKAPLNLLDRSTHRNGFLNGGPRGTRVDLVATHDGGATHETPGPALSAKLALCDSDTGVVRALRALELPAAVAEALRKAGHAQVTTFTCPTEVERATFHATRAATVEELMARAVERCRVAAR